MSNETGKIAHGQMCKKSPLRANGGAIKSRLSEQSTDPGENVGEIVDGVGLKEADNLSDNRNKTVQHEIILRK